MNYLFAILFTGSVFIASAQSQVMTTAAVTTNLPTPELTEEILERSKESTTGIEAQLEMIFDKIALVETKIYGKEEVGELNKTHLIRKEEQVYYMD